MEVARETLTMTWRYVSSSHETMHEDHAALQTKNRCKSAACCMIPQGCIQSKMLLLAYLPTLIGYNPERYIVRVSVQCQQCESKSALHWGMTQESWSTRGGNISHCLQLSWTRFVYFNCDLYWLGAVYPSAGLSEPQWNYVVQSSQETRPLRTLCSA